MAPNGSYLVFSSNRPATEGGKAIDGFFQGKPQPGKGGNLWRVNRTRNGWSKLSHLPDELNTNNAIYSPSVARNGNLYFNQSDPVSKKERLCWSQWIDGHYTTPQPVSFDDATTQLHRRRRSRRVVHPVFRPASSQPGASRRLRGISLTTTRWKQPVPFKPYLYGGAGAPKSRREDALFRLSAPQRRTQPKLQIQARTLPSKIWQISLKRWLCSAGRRQTKSRATQQPLSQRNDGRAKPQLTTQPSSGRGRPSYKTRMHSVASDKPTSHSIRTR